MMTWVDVFVLLTLAIAFWGGYHNGAVREAVLVVALLVAWLAAGSLAGPLAFFVRNASHLAPASAHLASFWFLFLLVFALVRLAGWAADREVTQPYVRAASRAAGGFVACAEAIALLWLVLFIGLFFPLAPDVRTTLRQAPTVRWIQAINEPMYGIITQALPTHVRPVGHFILRSHHL